MPSLKLSNILHRDPDAPTLRERAASLRAAVARRKRPQTSLPEAGSPEAMAAFHRACTATDRLMLAARDGYPALRRTELETWTTGSLSHALDTGEVAPVEYARLMPLAVEREHRMNAARLATNIDALFALAYAKNYPQPPVEDGDDADKALLDIQHAFDTATAVALAADRTLNRLGAEARVRIPVQPACTVMRETDIPFGLTLNPQRQIGDHFGLDDIERMQTYRFVREVWREARPGETAWDRRHNRVPELLPWPEAQARADEVVAADAAWRTEYRRIDAELGLDAAGDATDAAWSATTKIVNDIAALPATTADGLRLKLRALALYEPNTDPEMPGGRLVLSLLRDAEAIPYHPDEA